MLLYLRMAIYVSAIPVAAYLGGTYDPVAQTLTIDLDELANLVMGLGTAAATFGTSRIAKAKGGAT